MKFSRKRLLSIVVLLLLIGFNVWAYTHRVRILDWWQLRDYQPTSQITALVSDTALTNEGTRLFYINHPALEDKQAFNQHCAATGMETAVLGCYHGDRQGIYLYAVTDSRLKGVRQVTAAHEMLHQAYDRLSDKERRYVDNLLKDFYEHGLTDKDIVTKIDAYKGQPNTALVNEMHSIFGSEVRNLPAPLENYYAQYFSDRARIVSYSEAYRGEFSRRQAQVDTYDIELAALKVQIDANKVDLERRSADLDSLSAQINRDTAAHNQVQYQADVTEYNVLVNTYNSKLSTTKKLIDKYNDIVAKRNEIAVQERQLQTAIDSRPATTQ